MPVDTNSLTTIVAEVIERRGYVVIGVPANSRRHKVGDVAQRVFNVFTGQTFKITAVTNAVDYVAQSDLIQSLRPAWRRHPDGRDSGSRFYRAVREA